MRIQIIIGFCSIFVATVSGFDLKCKTVNGNLWFVAITKYCEVESIMNITTPNETITTVNGQTTPTDFQGVHFLKGVVHFLPKGLGKFFPDVKSLAVEFGGLKSIQKSDLEGLSQLEEFYVIYNDIEVLSSDLFDFTPKLQYIHFGWNLIRAIGRNLFTNLKSLKVLHFNNNKCIDQMHRDSDILNFIIQMRSQCPHEEDKETEAERLETLLSNLKQENDQLKSTSKNLEKVKIEVKELKTENQRLETLLNNFKHENDQLKSTSKNLEQEIEHLKRSCYNGLLDSSTKYLHKLSKTLKNCIKSEDSTDFNSSKGEEVVLKLQKTIEKAIAVDLKVVKPGLSITKVVDESGSETQTTQTELVIDQQQTLFLPINLGQIFSKLNRLSVISSGLFAIDDKTFDMKHLTALNLTGNKLMEIAADTFANLINLKELDLSHNNIEMIDTDAFKANLNLELLRLDHNQLTAINSGLLGNQKSLKTLLMNDNKLKHISSDLLSASNTLQVADLSNNVCIDLSYPKTSLKEIEAQVLENCIVPVELKCKDQSADAQKDESYCEADDLTIVNPKTKFSWNGSAHITILSIDDQKTLFVPSKLAETLPQLAQLTVKRSKLTTLFQSDFKGLESLQEIIIIWNDINLIEEGVFDEVPQLTYLSLASNNIKSLPPKTFAKLVNLKTLILSGNQLKTFTASLLPKRNVIEELQLQENELKVIEFRVLMVLKTIEGIDLSANTCIDAKYVKSGVTGRNLPEIYGLIAFQCSEN